MLISCPSQVPISLLELWDGLDLSELFNCVVGQERSPDLCLLGWGNIELPEEAESKHARSVCVQVQLYQGKGVKEVSQGLLDLGIRDPIALASGKISFPGVVVIVLGLHLLLPWGARCAVPLSFISLNFSTGWQGQRLSQELSD